MTLSLEQMVESYDPGKSLEQASTPPAYWYRDPRILELEYRTVFSRAWQAIGRSDQLREPGHYITSELATEPVLAVRGSDGCLRGFYNVCRHHAAIVMTQSEGQTETLRCPYHGWTYDLQGALVLAPEFGGVAKFDRSAISLVPIEIDVYKNGVFAKLEHGNPSLQDFLGKDLVERFEALNLEQLKWFERRSYTLNCNWKVFVDNYLDGGYHVPHLHRRLNSVLDYGHYTIETGKRFCLQSSPIVPDSSGGDAGELRRGERALYYWIYPNLMINIYAGVMDTNLVVSRGVDRTEVIFDYYFADVSAEAKKNNLASVTLSEQIQAEDVAICESVQRGLNSRSYSAGRLSLRREAGEHLFHKLLYTDLKAGLSG
ncbi:MAG TPA: aromatic ring-hydroxylating dioxygenase subunit alpha [Candidatus Binatia bacterium]|nr:aromatic ring-hydroxylating dioxygenase subunit alpha [Candidatus Binatia bacterium]